MPKTRVLTLKQKKFVQEYVKNRGNGTQAVLASYDTKDSQSAGEIASSNLRKVEVQEELAKTLDRAGLSTTSLSESLATALHAGLAGKATMADALRAIELGYKMRGLMPANKSISARLDIKYDGLDFKSLKKELEASQEKNKELLAE